MPAPGMSQNDPYLVKTRLQTLTVVENAAASDSTSHGQRSNAVNRQASSTGHSLEGNRPSSTYSRSFTMIVKKLNLAQRPVTAMALPGVNAN